MFPVYEVLHNFRRLVCLLLPRTVLYIYVLIVKLSTHPFDFHIHNLCILSNNNEDAFSCLLGELIPDRLLLCGIGPRQLVSYYPNSMLVMKLQ